jgi:ABC-type glutathione transport system ATPase component
MEASMFSPTDEPAGRPAIAFDHVEIVARTREGERTLVKDFSVAVAPGEVVGLIGESGSGKTTAARAAIGLLDHNVRVTAGSISVMGAVVHSAEVNRCAAAMSAWSFSRLLARSTR